MYNFVESFVVKYRHRTATAGPLDCLKLF